jgi:DNA-binding CsgD family transcriptional regulator
MLPYPEMSETDYLIIRGLAEGRSRKLIADDTGLSIHTVNWRIARLRDKTRTASPAELVAFGYESGFLRRKRSPRRSSES